MRSQFNGLMIGVGIGLFVVGSGTAPRVFAQAESTQDIPPPAEALPPPPMDDPEVAAPAPANHAKAAKIPAAAPPSLVADPAPVPATGELTSTDPTPPKPSLTRSAAGSATTSAADSRLTSEGSGASIRTMDNGDRIEEYRSGGQLTRVKVTPAKGPSYEILDANGDGHLDQKDAPNGVQPVGWTLFKWH